MTTSTLAALAGISVAAAIYYARRPESSAIRGALGPVPGVVERLYYVNEIAETGVIRGVLQAGLGRSAAAFDKYVVDGVVNGIGLATRFAGGILRISITGQLQAYTSVYLLGVLVAIGAIFVLSGGLLERLAP